ncbi:unnamed protein product [Arctogadus glacialis]
MAGFGSEYLKGETGSGSGKPSSPPSLEKESGEENMDSITETRSAGPDLSDKQLLEVVKTLGQEWEQVAIHLEMDDIKADGQTDVAMQKLKMLVLWRDQRPPGEATAEDLLRALEDLEDLPVETRQLLTGIVIHPNKHRRAS